MRPWPRLVLALACALAGVVAAPSALASVGSPPPVPSLDPRGTQAEWERLVQRPVFRPYAVEADCRPLRGVFYAQTDWLRLATTLAANASPCAQYSISVPPVVADKTRFRPDQAQRIRALGPSIHALAEIPRGPVLKGFPKLTRTLSGISTEESDVRHRGGHRWRR